MGYALVERLLDAGCDVAVYNRTRAKAEPLTGAGATVVGSPADLADRDIVFTMVGGSDDYREVVLGPNGVLASAGQKPKVIVDSTTVSLAVAEDVRERAAKVGVEIVAANVSGNPSVVGSGLLTVVASGNPQAFDYVAPYLNHYGRGVSYVGEGEVARLVKICHNLILGVLTQSLAETTVLAERFGVSREAFLTFINESVLGSTFTRYKMPAFVNLDFEPSFTGHLLRKDFELGLEAGRELDVPLPVASLVHQLIVSMIGEGLGDVDFAALLEVEARGAGLSLEPENANVTDGLEQA